MNRQKQKILKLVLLNCLMVVFFLVALPLGLVSIYPDQGLELPEAEAPSVGASYIQVYRHVSGETETIDFEDYVKGVVAGEMPADFEMEALKAQAVAARTYSISKIIRSGDRGNPQHPSAPICDDTHCQVYRSPEELKEIKSAQWMDTGWTKISEAVDSTRGQLLYYEGQLVEQPLFHSSSGGKTENSEDVFVSALPYLRSVDSPYEDAAPHHKQQTVLTLIEFTSKIKSSFPGKELGVLSSDTIRVTDRSEGGRVASMKIGNLSLKGREVRDLLNLRSANFTVSVQNNQVVFTSDGFGHGVGMSQWGANGMAQAGLTYKEILSHYYSGTEVK